MVQFLNEDVAFRGNVKTEREFLAEGELIADGTLTIGPGGVSVGDSIINPSGHWPGQVRVQVADTTERAAVKAWRDANDPISASNPLLVWRANGSLNGVNEITLNGTDWYAESPLAGDIEMTMAAVAPYGWALLNGQLLGSAATNYPALWANASPAYRVGGDLRLPDLRGRVPMGVGQGTGLTLRNIGDLIGAESVVLTEAQLARHRHAGLSDLNDRSLNHWHNITGAVDESGDSIGGNDHVYLTNRGSQSTSYIAGTSASDTNLAHRHAFTSDFRGEDQPHPNVQPSTIVNFKVKL